MQGAPYPSLNWGMMTSPFSTWDLAVPELSLLLQMGELPGEFGSPRGGGGNLRRTSPLVNSQPGQTSSATPEARFPSWEPGGPAQQGAQSLG